MSSTQDNIIARYDLRCLAGLLGMSHCKQWTMRLLLLHNGRLRPYVASSSSTDAVPLDLAGLIRTHGSSARDPPALLEINIKPLTNRREGSVRWYRRGDIKRDLPVLWLHTVDDLSVLLLPSNTRNLRIQGSLDTFHAKLSRF